jgi:hypothetical protein
MITHIFQKAVIPALLLSLQLPIYAADTSPVLVADKAGSSDFAAPTTDIQGMWVWRREQVATDDAQDKLLDFCKAHGFNRILLQIHTTRDSEGNVSLALAGQLPRLLKKAAEQGIRIEALDGAKDMAMKKNWPATLAILEAVLEFNRAQPEGARFVGIHYDIEPYIMPEWKTDARMEIMQDYLAYLKQARDIAHAETPKLLLSADIPMWYDRKTEDGDNCILEFDGQTKNLHEHVQDICDYIGIMSYRRTALGRNSVVDAVTTEIEYAEKIGKTVCPALETIELKEDQQISFFGVGPEAYLKTKGEVEKELTGRSGYGGMLIHSYDGLQRLFNESAK